MGKTHRNHRNAKGPTPQLRSRNTRSSKGRLLTETSSSTTQLTAQLSLLGLYPAPTIGDGNCLFRALSDQLYGSPSKHLELRQQICDHIAKHKSRYEPFVEDERGLEAHLRAMRENATYGGHMELSAFAHMTKRNVKVVQPGLVYVIEWSAAGWEDGAGSSSMIAAGSDASDQAESSSSSQRRASRRSTKPVSPTKAQEETRIKLGKGYFVYEEVGSDEEEEDIIEVGVEVISESSGPTVYVAYHDWEHFSSIRNLSGPHTGLPNVSETPPPDPISAKEREKDKERERKKESERREKERKEKERERKGRERKEKEKVVEAGSNSASLPKVKLKLTSSVSENSNASLPVPVNAGTLSSSSLTPAASSRCGSQPLYDPSLIPLPISRSSSPFVGSSSSLVASSAASPLPSSSLANEIYPEDPSPNAHISTTEGLGHSHRHPLAHILQTPRSQFRSPKRTFDESSASGGEENPENSKRSRRRRVGSGGWSGADADSTPDVSSVREDDVVKYDEVGEVVDIVMHVDADGKADEADTPSLCAPGSTSSSPLSSVASSVASSVSGASSEVDVDDDVELESQADDPDNEITSEIPSSTLISTPLVVPDGQGKNAHHVHSQNDGERPLTRRQRKALGLPKARKGVPVNIHGSNGTPTSLSAGKIVIPGGKWKGKGDSAELATTVDGLADGQGDAEWRRNGSGRLDVRGFRELTI